jgi:triphosphoribosyl-dephospho-CoA synthetase
MNLKSFLRTLLAITPYFEQLAYYGAGLKGLSPTNLSGARKIGQLAEVSMFRATGGVNTLKSTIFLLGIAVTVAGYSIGQEEPLSSRKVARLSGEWTSETMTGELTDTARGSYEPKTGGERACATDGFEGARGEVLRGYPTSLNVGLAALSEARTRGCSENDASVHALVSLMAMVNDTAIHGRLGLKGVLWAEEMAGEAVDCGGMLIPAGRKKIQNLKLLFEKYRVNPGRSADLLSLSLFFEQLERI